MTSQPAQLAGRDNLDMRPATFVTTLLLLLVALTISSHGYAQPTSATMLRLEVGADGRSANGYVRERNRINGQSMRAWAFTRLYEWQVTTIDIDMQPDCDYVIELYHNSFGITVNSPLFVKAWLDGQSLVDYETVLTPWDGTIFNLCDPSSPSCRLWGGTYRASCRYPTCDEGSESYDFGSRVQIGWEPSEASHPDGVRLLVAKHSAAETYPTLYQIEPAGSRPRMRLRGTLRNATTQAPITEAKTVYLRLRDPADSADYITSTGNAHEGDNHDVGVTLSTNGGSVGVYDTCVASCEPLQVTTDAQGAFDVVLTGTGYASGDNYFVEASTRPDMSCASPAACARTATITAWKRVTIERRQMYRRSYSLARDIEPGDAVAVVEGRCWNRFAGSPDVRIMHGRSVSTPGDSSYSEVRSVVDARNSDGNCQLTLDQEVERHYSRRDGSFNDPALGADAVALNGGEVFTAVPLEPSRSIMTAAFADVVASDSQDPLPNVRFDVDNMDSYSSKWLGDPSRKNTFWLVAADRLDKESNPVGAVTTSFRRAIYVFEGRISDFGSLSLAAETTAHELTHGFGYEHCEHSRYDDPTKSCLMVIHFFLKDWRDPLGATQPSPRPEYQDGKAALHVVNGESGVDSEYLVIRRRAEPVPDH